MNDIEKKLLAEKRKIQSLDAPQNFDEQINQSLNSLKNRRSQPTLIKMIILTAALLLLTLITYNHQAIAYYSKKIMGFDHIYGSIATLNEEEKGQVIEKTIELEDGLYFTVNGIMTDANQLVLFYTYFAPDGLNNYNLHNYSIGSIHGFMSNASPQGGTAYKNDMNTKEKGIYHFEAVHPLAKKLNLVIWNFEQDNDKEITFKHDPNKAMKASLDIQIDVTFPLDKGTVNIDTITASPTMTLLKGTIDVGDYDEFFEYISNINLFVDDQNAGSFGGISSRTEDGKDTTFTVNFDPLPESFHRLHVELGEFIGFEPIKETIEVKEDVGNSFNFKNEQFEISPPKQIGNEVEFSVTSNVGYQFATLSLENGVEAKLIDEKGIIKDEQKQRIYRFKSNTIPKHIIVEGIYFPKTYDQTVDIPLNQR